MKAILVKKIEIKNIDIKEYTDKFVIAERAPIEVRQWVDAENMESSVGINEVVYTRFTILNKNREKINYFVKTSEEGIFQDLVDVTYDSIEKNIQKRLNIEANIIKSRVERQIKMLPWWKRLFNLF